MSLFREYAQNMEGRDYVCGDIHGCFSDLEDELKRIGFDKSLDRLFCVGDLADRGPESREALGYLRQPWFHTVLGNHEDVFLQCWIDKTASSDWHYGNGGDWPYECTDDYIRAYGEAVKELPLVIRLGSVLILHSLLPPVESLDKLVAGIEQYREYILWERDPRYHFDGLPFTVIAGHTIVKQPTKTGCVIDIDTGAFLKHWRRPGYLTVREIQGAFE
jgi:serine/threonine protein phosphatase 1